jgi:hypothetical protein
MTAGGDPGPGAGTGGGGRLHESEEEGEVGEVLGSGNEWRGEGGEVDSEGGGGEVLRSRALHARPAGPCPGALGARWSAPCCWCC